MANLIYPPLKRAFWFRCRSRPSLLASVRPFRDDPDTFKGPGGLTGRQIFAAVQDSVRRDQQARGATPPSSHDISNRSKSNVKYLSVRELKERLSALEVAHADCLDKVDRSHSKKKYDSPCWLQMYRVRIYSSGFHYFAKYETCALPLLQR